MPEPVYFDHAATTPVREEVFAAMQPFFGPRFGNPSSMHRWGREARTALDEARERVGRCLGASPDEVVFTSCGTEADNMALIGVWRARRGEGGRRAAVSTPIEHKAVLGALHEIAKEGGEERLLAVDSAGRVTASSFDELVRQDTAVCSVMWVNNEIGTLQDVPALAERARSRGVVFHTDAVQAFGKIDIDARRTPFDLLSISGHKIGAPKGIGALFIRRGTPMEPLLFGGSQDRGRRPGTENVAMAVGLACAAELAVAEREDECRRLEGLRERLEQAILAKVPDAVINGREATRAPHIANISVPGTESESMLIALDLRGVLRRRERLMRERVLVAMSGGVDSSVAAALLVRQGYDVVGATMKLFCHGDDLPDRPCCSLDSVNDARRICEQLGIPHYVLNLESAFGHDVVQDFVDEYARGRTPIPCVRCNTFTKFRDLVRRADAMEARWIATGHYARVIDGVLHRGLDPAKDQSYFLWGIDRRVLSRMLLPVGAQTKAETRAIAHELGLELIAEKRESQDICFVPDGDHARVIAHTLGADTPALAPGPLVLRDGTVIGEHDGYARFTIGQRRGLPGGFAEPMFVVEIEPTSRTVVIGPRDELLGQGLVAREVNWLVDAPPVGTELSVQIRHHARPGAGVLVRRDSDEVEIALDEPVSAISPGQSVVLYAADRVLGGGVIERGRRLLPVRAA